MQIIVIPYAYAARLISSKSRVDLGVTPLKTNLLARSNLAQAAGSLER